MQAPEPTSEHQWLLKLVGNWTFEHDCNMGPDQPAVKCSGKQTTVALGSLWTVGEMENAGPDGQPAKSIISVGFDPARGKFVGTFISSCMPQLWIYEGSLDEGRKILTLNAEGPSFAGDGTMAKYQDIIELVDDNQYLFYSQFLNADGSWNRFMDGKYTRVK
jgi:hypothetical protein